MKILYVTTISLTMNSFFKPHIEMLVKEGNQVDLACNFKELALASSYYDLGCNAYQVDFSRSPLSFDNLRAFIQLDKIVKDGNYDIVHCHTPNASVITRLVCQKYRKKEGLKVLYTAHGFHFYEGSPILNWMVYYPVEKICSYFTDRLITINSEDYELAKSKFKSKEIHYVPGVGVDFSRFGNDLVDTKAKRQELGVPENAFLMLSVGELNENKNHQVIIRALEKLNNQNAHYAIAGVGDKKDYLLDLAQQLGVSEQVHLLGYRRDIEELIRMSDVFCFPSQREGLGLAAIEAMACGLPVIAANNRGTREFVYPDQNGFLCDCFDADAFAEALNKVISDRTLRERLSKSTYNAVERFDVNNVLNIMKKVYG